MKSIVIYKSKTDFSKKYAQWIQEELQCDMKPFEHMNKLNLSTYDVVLFGGGIYAGKVNGLNTMKKLDLGKRLIVYATGATPAETDDIKKMWSNNFSESQLTSIPHFYLPAGINYERMSFTDKLLMKLFHFLISKKQDKSKEDLGMLNAVKKSYDITNKTRLEPLLSYVKSFQ